jgi:hypothetical protein
MNKVPRVAQGIVSDTIGNDTIVINVQTGAYYSLTVQGGEAWAAIQAGNDGKQSHAAWLTLGNEGILDLSDWPNAETEPMPEAEVFEKYTDMESLLLADPIHEVDEQGWPKLR